MPTYLQRLLGSYNRSKIWIFWRYSLRITRDRLLIRSTTVSYYVHRSCPRVLNAKWIFWTYRIVDLKHDVQSFFRTQHPDIELSESVIIRVRVIRVIRVTRVIRVIILNRNTWLEPVSVVVWDVVGVALKKNKKKNKKKTRIYILQCPLQTYYFRIRPYHVECTRSHPNSEVIMRWASSVLRWGTRTVDKKPRARVRIGNFCTLVSQ